MALLNKPSETPAEAEVRIDKLLEANSKPLPRCIACMEPITKDQRLVESIHGPYHGLPLTCVNGRD